MLFISLFSFGVLANKLNIDIKSLPMDLSFSRTRGKGTRNIYLFCDLECPHCIRTEKFFNQIDDINIHTFVFPVASYHPNAPQKTTAIWCSNDKAKSWQEWFDKGILPSNPKDCKAPLSEIEQYAHNNNIELPVIIFEDGTGYHAEDFIYATLKLDKLQELIDNHSTSSHKKLL